jgi:hypothetical protein
MGDYNDTFIYTIHLPLATIFLMIACIAIAIRIRVFYRSDSGLWLSPIGASLVLVITAGVLLVIYFFFSLGIWTLGWEIWNPYYQEMDIKNQTVAAGPDTETAYANYLLGLDEHQLNYIRNMIIAQLWVR